MIDAKQNTMQLLVAGRDRLGKVPLLLSKFIYIDGETDMEKVWLYIARWASKQYEQKQIYFLKGKKTPKIQQWVANISNRVIT